MCTHKQKEKRKEEKALLLPRPNGVDLSTVPPGMHAENATCEVCVHMCICAHMALYACCQRVQIHALESAVSFFSKYLKALRVGHRLSVRLRLSLLIKHNQKQKRREHRMRKEAEEQHK